MNKHPEYLLNKISGPADLKKLLSSRNGKVSQ